ncbi:hypothetical protein KUTeg_020031 [Tegillarca granosa]|uniref:Uncharacterized protein n=1 Tax=Tegillarca granosa TaxID=220873 RepID=A0ABQ9EEP2_TEGGR|nr:hypothetical protein KUTeg_020031 [Tegillarca granosa]
MEVRSRLVILYFMMSECYFILFISLLNFPIDDNNTNKKRLQSDRTCCLITLVRIHVLCNMDTVPKKCIPKIKLVMMISRYHCKCWSEQVTCVDFHKFGILLDQNAKNNISRQKNIHYKDFNMLKQTKQTQNFAYMNNIIQALNQFVEMGYFKENTNISGFYKSAKMRETENLFVSTIKSVLIILKKKIKTLHIKITFAYFHKKRNFFYTKSFKINKDIELEAVNKKNTIEKHKFKIEIFQIKTFKDIIVPQITYGANCNKSLFKSYYNKVKLMINYYFFLHAIQLTFKLCSFRIFDKIRKKSLNLRNYRMFYKLLPSNHMIQRGTEESAGDSVLGKIR